MTGQDLTGWTIVFDLDGTLVDSAPDLHGALNHCLAAGGFRTVPFEAISGMIGKGAKAMIRQALDFHRESWTEDTVEALWGPFLDHYRANICNLSRPYPGAARAIATLRGDGATCAVCTNKTQGLTDPLLDGLGLADYFSAVVGADSVPARKPDGGHVLQTIARSGGKASRAIMVGDSQTDERAARNAGLPFVFVTFGYGPAPSDLAGIRRASSWDEVLRAIRETVRQPRP